jgi:hypothetical protein
MGPIFLEPEQHFSQIRGLCLTLRHFGLLPSFDARAGFCAATVKQVENKQGKEIANALQWLANFGRPICSIVLRITPRNKKTKTIPQSRVLDWLRLQVVTMLAEIFMVRLEAKARTSAEKVPASSYRFVPFVGTGQFAFKADSADRPSDVAGAKISHDTSKAD